jgi:hypothetical protein
MSVTCTAASPPAARISASVCARSPQCDRTAPPALRT